MTTQSKSVLVVEDDVELAKLTSNYLSDNGYQVSIEHNGSAAVNRILDESPDMVVLDIMLPGADGIEICRRVREQFKGFIIMLTARTGEIDQILGLEIGADDYLSKPVEPRLLLARIKAIFRRQTEQHVKADPQADDTSTLYFGELRIEKSSRCVFMQEMELDLSTPEYDLLLLLAEQAGTILSREHIFKTLRGIDYDGQSRSIDIIISQLRNKLGDNPSKPRLIKTIRNKGYMLAVS